MMNAERRFKRTNTILHAARQLFARQGYHGTSTKELARLAGIAENTLFRYFDCKEDLFWAALRSSLSGLELRLNLISTVGEGANPEIVFPKFITQLVDTTILKPELLRLIVIAIIELPGKASAVLNEYISPLISVVNEYISESIERAKLREVSPSLVTAAMISTTIAYPALATLIAGTDITYSDDSEVIRAYSRFWLEVLSPIGGPR